MCIQVITRKHVCTYEYIHFSKLGILLGRMKDISYSVTNEIDHNSYLPVLHALNKRT